MKSSRQKFKRVRPMLGAFVEIELRGHASLDLLNTWITEGFAAVAEVDRLMSIHRTDSDVSRLNRAKLGEWIDVNPLTLKVLKASNELWRASKGVFDIRHPSFPASAGAPAPRGVGHAPRSPMASGRGGEPIHGPPTETLGGDGKGRARKLGPWTFDLGGIAKGFAVDRAVETMQRRSRGHLTGGVVNAGGDLRVWGPGTTSSAVRIDGPAGTWLSRIGLRQTAVATSAFRMPGPSHERLSVALHIRTSGRRLAGRQGHPRQEEKCATVFAARCLWSDALTKVVLMGNPSIARSCLSTYRAQAIVFGESGTEEILP